ncbi:MAG: DUF1015 domain-containing protein, partial [Endomicrobium sp.]|nr:DUF1015 domain-containing protein [Endomicrobium sp.]
MIDLGDIMVEISEFNAIRFSENDITDFICPPYDVIAPDEKEKLKKMSPFNIVNIELPDLLGKKNKYEKAADLFRLWQSTGVLKRDKNSALYFYEQIFSDHGIQMSRNGFFAAMKLSDPNSYKSPVKLHEKTLINQKHDRFEFLETVKANISPIFCFFNDENFIIKNVFNKTCKKIPSAIARDGNGTFHKLWVVNDEYLIKTVKKCLFDKNVFIADGHHRYEIAWEYNKKKIKENTCRCSLQEDHNYVLTYFCPVEDQYISIWPTHRIVDEPLELELNICKYFDVHSARDFQRLSKKDIQPIMIFKNGKYRVLTIKKYSLLKKNMPNNS